MIREKEIERYLVQEITRRGGLCWKFTSPGTVGVPDRIILLRGRVAFAELKRPEGGNLSESQKFRLKQIRSCGGTAAVLKSTEEVDRFVESLLSAA